MEESVTLVPGRAALHSAGLEVAAVSVLQDSMWVLEVTDLKLEHPDCSHSLRLYRERHEKNHSPLQVEVSAVSFCPHIWLPVDLSAPVSGIEPRYPVRSCALHPRVREDRGPCCALWRWQCPPSPPPPPPFLRPLSAQLSSSPVLNPRNSRKATSSRPGRSNHNYLCGFIPKPAHPHAHSPLLLLLWPGVDFHWEMTRVTKTHTSHKHTLLRDVFLPPPALRGFTGPICRLT